MGGERPRSRREYISKRNRIAFLRSPNLRSEVQAYLTASDALSGRLAEVGGSPELKHPAEDSCPFGTEATNRRTRTRPRPRSHTSMWGVGSPKPNIGPKPNSNNRVRGRGRFFIFVPQVSGTTRTNFSSSCGLKQKPSREGRIVASGCRLLLGEAMKGAKPPY